MKEYKKSQITKHALMYFLQKPDMTEKDRNTVQNLLNETIEHVEWLKKKYNIK